MSGSERRAGRALRGAYGALNGVYWMLCCLAYSFTGVFLLGRGYSNSQLGVIAAAGQVLGLALQPLLAALADRSARAPLAVIGGATAAVAATAAGLTALAGRSWAVTALTAAFMALVIALQPLVNGFAYYLERLGTAVPFGACRAVGSLAYGLLAAVLGRIVLGAGEIAVPAAGVLIAGAMLLLAALFARAGTPPPVERQTAASASPGGLLADRRFRRMLAATALLFFAHAILSSFTIQIVENVGGDSGDMGLLTGYIAVLELPGMLLFERLLRRSSAGGLLRFAAVFFAVKTLLALAASSVAGLYGAMFFQGLSYALFIPTSVRWAGGMAGPDRVNRAQAWITAMITVGNICAATAGGLLLDGIGVRGTLAAASVSAAAGAALMVWGVRK